MLNLPRLRVLRELYRRKTLSAVAAAMSYSTSAVSQQIRLLEKEVGVSLVEPLGRRLQLTPQGLILVAYTDQLLAMMETAEAEVSSSLDQPRGTIRIAAFETAAAILLPRALKILKSEHPELTVVFEQGEPEATLPALASSEYNLVVAESYPAIPLPIIPGISVETIMTDPVWLAVGGDLRNDLDPNLDILPQLQRFPWAVEPEESASRQWITRECRNVGFEPMVTCSSEDISVHLRFVEAGLAVSALPSLALELAVADVDRYPIHPYGSRRDILLATRKAAQKDPGTLAVAEALKRAAHERSSERDRSH